MTEIRRRGPNRYLIVIYLGRDADGKRIRKSETFYGTRHQAELRGAELEVRYKRPAGPRASAMRLEQYLQKWLLEVEGTVAERTWETYEWHVRRLIPLVGHLPLYGLSAMELQETMRGMEGAPATIKNIQGTLKTALRQAVAWDLIPSDPTLGLRYRRVPRKSRRVLQPGELDAVLEAARGYKHYPVLRLLAGTGMRLGEALGLKWSDMDLERGIATIRRSVDTRKRCFKPEDDPKTETSLRTVELDLETVILLSALKQDRMRERVNRKVSPLRIDDELVFGPGDRPLGEYSVRRTLNAALKKAGLSHIRLHDLRHGAGSIMLDRGVPLPQVAALLGHTPDTLMKVYAHALRQGKNLFDLLRLEKENH